MMKNIIIAVALLLAMANFFVIGLKNPDPAEVIFTNIEIKDSRYQKNLNTIAYANGKIIFIGNEQTVHPLIDKDTQVIKMNENSQFYLTDIKNKDDIKTPNVNLLNSDINVGSTSNAIIYENGQLKYFIQEGKIK